MHKYLSEICNYLQFKILAGVGAAIFSEDFFKLLLIFIGLEILDIFTRWLALSQQCYKALYPQTPCNMYRALLWMWQAHKWRFIKSDGLRDGFCHKMLMYLLLLLVGAFVDAAFQIAHTPRLLTTIIVVVLASTEGLSILENLSECNGLIGRIKEKFSAAVNKSDSAI